MYKSAIDKFYIQGKKRICQGDLLRDLKFKIAENDSNNDIAVAEHKFNYALILSQDCDISEGDKYFQIKSEPDKAKEFNQFLPNLLVLPAFELETIKNGQHLIGIYKVSQERINSERLKLIKKNKNLRYHYLPSEQSLQIPELIIDFKIYYSLNFDSIRKIFDDAYLASVNELFRELISQRYCNYLSRIGTPELIQVP